METLILYDFTTTGSGHMSHWWSLIWGFIFSSLCSHDFTQLKLALTTLARPWCKGWINLFHMSAFDLSVLWTLSWWKLRHFFHPKLHPSPGGTFFFLLFMLKQFFQVNPQKRVLHSRRVSSKVSHLQGKTFFHLFFWCHQIYFTILLSIRHSWPSQAQPNYRWNFGLSKLLHLRIRWTAITGHGFFGQRTL